jgi:hypothetical protein
MKNITKTEVIFVKFIPLCYTTLKLTYMMQHVNLNKTGVAVIVVVVIVIATAVVVVLVAAAAAIVVVIIVVVLVVEKVVVVVVLGMHTCGISIDNDGVAAMGMMCEIQNAVGLS